MRFPLRLMLWVILLTCLTACHAHSLHGSANEVERKFDALVPMGTPYEEISSRLLAAGVAPAGPLIEMTPPGPVPGVTGDAVVYRTAGVDLGSFRQAPFFLFRNEVSLMLYFDRESRLIGRKAFVEAESL